MKIITLAAVCLLFGGCSTIKPETRLKLSKTATVLGGVATKAAIQIALNKAVSELDRKNKGDILYGLTDGLRRSQDEVVTANDIRRVWNIWTDTDKDHWAKLREATVAIYKDGIKKGYSKDVVIESIARELQKAIVITNEKAN